MAIEAGKKAPAFTLAGSDGTQHSLDRYAGKHVIIYFYPKDDTPGCTKEACAFRDILHELQAKGAVVLGVSPDGAESHGAFIRKFELPFVLLSDPDHEMMRAYEAFGEKTSYGKKTMGVIRSTVWIAPDGTVVKHWRRVRDAEVHPADVLEAIEAYA